MRFPLASWMVLSAVGTAAPAAADGFFGITADTRVDELRNCKPGKSEFNFDCEFPNASPFSEIQINFDPSKGTCGITATTRPAQTEDDARAVLKSAYAFLDEFSGVQESSKSQLRQIANGASGSWFDDAQRLNSGLVSVFVFRQPRADKLKMMFMFVSKAWLKPGVEVRVSGHCADRTLCVPPPVHVEYK